MTDEEQVRRAEQAKALMSMELWNEGWESVRAHCLDIFERTPISELSQRESAKRLLNGAIAARMFWERVIRDGKAAAANIEQDKRQRKSGTTFHT